MTSRRAESGRRFYTLSWTVLCVSILVTVQAFAASKHKLTGNTVIAKSLGAVTLKPEGVRVVVELVPEERRKSESLAARIANVPQGKSLYLVFKNLQTTKQPGELYHVYLNLKEDEKPGASDRPAGVLNFYNFVGNAPRGSDQFFSFDVTEALQKLAAAKQLSEPLTVTIIPAQPPAEDIVPTIGQIELVEQ
jgi:hypothetical protein